MSTPTIRASVFSMSLWVLACPLAAQEAKPHEHPHGQAEHGQAEHGQAEHGQAEHGQAGHGHGEHGHHMPHDFSDAELWSERFDSAERQAWQKPAEVVELMEIAPGMTVADIGAGTGYFLGYLSAAVGPEGRVQALDVEETLVDFMRERAQREGWANVEPRRIPYDGPEVADGTLDRVLIVNTWHHIEGREAYSAKLYRALKRGGRVYIVDLTKDSPTGPPPEHRLEPQRIMAELESGGFEVRLLEETLPRQFIVVGETK